jgi:hypothetical protein
LNLAVRFFHHLHDHNVASLIKIRIKLFFSVNMEVEGAKQCFVLSNPKTGKVITDQTTINKAKASLAARGDKRKICDTKVTQQVAKRGPVYVRNNFFIDFRVLT